MKPWAAMLGVLSLTVIAGGEEDRSKAPLEGAKQELRALQADQAAQKNGAVNGKLTDGLPQLDSPLPGATALESVSPAKMEKEMKKRKDAQKNWLLDGVSRLEKSGQANTSQKNSRRRDADRDSDEATSDEKDETLLSVYENQGNKNAEAKTDNTRSAPQKTDPLAPFLQGWLADSPVRRKFFDDYAGRSDRGGAGASTVSLPASGAAMTDHDSASLGTGRFSAASPVQANPYLQAQSVTPTSDFGTASPAQLQALTGNPVMIGPPPAGTARDPAPVIRPPAEIPSLLAPTDAQKYFPQQKKF